MASQAAEDVHDHVRAEHIAAIVNDFHQNQHLQQQVHQQQYLPLPLPPSSTLQQPNLASQGVPLTPVQSGVFAGLSLLKTTPPTFSPPESVRPNSPVYSPGAGDSSGSGGMNALQAFAQATSPGGQLGGGTGGTGLGQSQGQGASISRVLTMDVDPPFPSPPNSDPSAASSPSTTIRTAYTYFPAPPVSVPHPAVQRHHPYAHPTHTRSIPPPLAHTQSSSTPLYFSAPPSAPQTPAVDSPGSPSSITSPPVLSPGTSFPLPPGPHRVHSAPAHLLSLSTTGLQEGNRLGGNESSGGVSVGEAMMEEGTYGGTQEWGGARPLLARHQSAAGQLPPVVGRDWEGDRAMSVDNRPMKQEVASPPSFFDSTAPTQQFYLTPYQPPPSAATSVPAPIQIPPPPLSIQLDSPVPAIALVRNRLPILEAALSASASDLGQDEEEIWKGVEGAYEELKRIMLGRREARRASGGKAQKRSYASIDLESPTTPSGPPPSQFHVSQATTDASLSLARAQAQVEASQAQLHQAQLQAQAQAQAEARARADTELRARAEEERLQREAEARAGAEAEDNRQRVDAARVHREHEAQYAQAQANHAFQLQQQEQQFRHAQQAADAHAQAVAQQQQQQQLQLQQQQQQQQLQLQYSNPQQFSIPTPQYPSPSTSSLPGLSAHIPHTPSPLSAIIPAHVSLNSALGSGPISPMAQPTSSPFGGAYEPSFDAARPIDMSGFQATNALAMGLSLGLPMHQPSAYAGGGGGTIDPMELSSGAPDASMEAPQQQWVTAQYASAPPSAGSSTPDPSAATAAPLSPPAIPSGLPGLPGLQSRPSRSRAASGSGYVSASGSRSRAASGSGYQSLLDSRSRAASSASSVFGTFERDDDDELDEDQDGEDGALYKSSSQAGVMSASVDPAFRDSMDPIFIEFLADLCSNLDATDSKGEPIHQTLMAKKMERLDQSQDFRPFKFRIQAFTSAFSEKLAASGFSEADVPFKKIRQYLWAHPCISRFNDDGKKAKSKGNHIWSIEAKKVPDKKWIFREFTRCIKGSPPNVAFAGLPWSWSPRVWDPQRSGSAIGAAFSSPSLPPWLEWKNNVLSGEAPEALTGQSVEITAVATFQTGGRVQQLEATCTILIASVGERTHESDEKPELSDTSLDASPAPSAGTPYRSPSLDAGSFPDTTSSAALLPSLMSDSIAVEHKTPMPKQEENNDDAYNLQIQAQAQAQHEHDVQQQLLSQGMFEYESVEMQQASQAQADLHHHYASLSALPPPFELHASQLSYTPSPELVADALERASFERRMSTSYNAVVPMDHTLQHLDMSQDGHNGLLSDVDGRLASFALSSSQHHTPFSVDPSNL